MKKHLVRNLKDAFAYIADCNLATVSHMACLKSKSKREFKRQIGIAQTMCDWMKRFDVDPTGTRAEEIEDSVHEWAKQYEE
ncbi:MAG: hypothetical protein SWO11_21280 [Thermodesulfobacteriota bacterium]|nr:hypothetical protein [Thermodesulfobacteriota bacterium]